MPKQTSDKMLCKCKSLPSIKSRQINKKLYFLQTTLRLFLTKHYIHYVQYSHARAYTKFLNLHLFYFNSTDTRPTIFNRSPKR